MIKRYNNDEGIDKVEADGCKKILYIFKNSQ